MSYTQNSPSFEAVQWTGSNTQEVRDFTEDAVGVLVPPMTVRAMDENDGSPEAIGRLLMQSYEHGYMASCGIGEWLIYGPMWGGQKEQAQFFVLSNEQFVEQFTAAE